jgi:hypothetical protein
MRTLYFEVKLTRDDADLLILSYDHSYLVHEAQLAAENRLMELLKEVKTNVPYVEERIEE